MELLSVVVELGLGWKDLVAGVAAVLKITRKVNRLHMVPDTIPDLIFCMLTFFY
jgi:hypothetical protein